MSRDFRKAIKNFGELWLASLRFRSPSKPREICVNGNTIFFMKKNEHCGMRVESEKIRIVERQDMCETVRNHREAFHRLMQENLDLTYEQWNTRSILV
jgi:hypothetical protein